MDCSDERAASAAEKLAAIGPLCNDLGQSVTCAICLEYMEQAQQMHCGHIFCAECVIRMLAMPKVRCAICKRKTSKRMIRPAPIPFGEIVSCLRALEAVAAECTDGKAKQAKALNDGFAAHTGAQLQRRRSTGEQRPPLSLVADNEFSRTPVAALGQQRELSPHSLPGKSASKSPVFDGVGKSGCVLCPERDFPGDLEKRSQLGKLTPIAGKRYKSFRVHENCALYSMDIYEVRDEFWNVPRTRAKTKKMKCSRELCRGSSPTTFCASAGCEKKYHFICALQEGVTLVEDGFKIFCEKHKSEAPEIDDDSFFDHLVDPAGSQSLGHEDVCFKCQTGGRLLICDTCPRVVHPVCEGLKGIPLDDWSCSVCRGLVSDSEQDNDSECTPSGSPIRNDDAGARRKRASLAEQSKSTQVGNASAKRARRSSQTASKHTEEIWRPVLCSTGLEEPQKVLLKGVADMKRTTVRPDFDSRVTHMIVNAFKKEDNPTRTLKLCKSIAAGVTLVCFKWIEDSVGSKRSWAEVEDYIHPWTRSSASGGLFQNMQFYFGGQRSSIPNKEDLMMIVKLGGGTVLTREPSLEKSPAIGGLYIVREQSTSRGGGRRSSNVFLEDDIPGAQVISSSWILDRCTIITDDEKPFRHTQA